ncbi:MAG: peptidyl-prolyl cis-trans isomerase [Thermoanaerobaculia bacterium]
MSVSWLAGSRSITAEPFRPHLLNNPHPTPVPTGTSPLVQRQNRRKLRMKKAILIALLVLFPLTAQAEIVEAIIARVGDRVITRSQYATRLSDGFREIEATTPPAEQPSRKATFQNDLFNEMLAELLIKDRADQIGLTVSAARVEEAIKSLMAQYGLETEEAFINSLQQSGLTRSEMELRLRDTLLTNELFRRELRSRADLSDRELRERYEREKDRYRLPERARVREIVVTGDEAMAMAKAEEAITRARAGEPFADLVTLYSDAPSKEAGGDIGMVSKGELLAALDAAVFSAPAGTVTGPVRTSSGYHVMLVEERLPSEVPSFDLVKERLRKEADEAAFQRDYEAYIERLRKDAFVQIYEKNIPQA